MEVHIFFHPPKLCEIARRLCGCSFSSSSLLAPSMCTPVLTYEVSSSMRVLGTCQACGHTLIPAAWPPDALHQLPSWAYHMWACSFLHSAVPPCQAPAGPGGNNLDYRIVLSHQS